MVVEFTHICVDSLYLGCVMSLTKRLTIIKHAKKGLMFVNILTQKYIKTLEELFKKKL